MKRKGFLFEKIVDDENLFVAYKNASRGKGWYAEVEMISKRPYYYLAGLKWMLMNHQFHTSAYTMTIRHEGGKDRQIYKLPFFPDRIVQWAIMQVIQQDLLATMTTDTYSSLPKRGIHMAFQNVRHDLDNFPDEMKYCCKIDCTKFYQSIQHDLLERAYRRKFKDQRLLALIDEITESISTCTATQENIDWYSSLGVPIEFVQHHGGLYIRGIGIPIGNYISQWDGNFFLSGLDHWMKEVQHVKFYYRYADDITFFGKTKAELQRILKDMNAYMRDKLHIRIKGNWQIFPTAVRGVDFVGYRCFSSYTLLRKTTYLAMRQKLSSILKKCQSGEEMNYSDFCTIGSYKGWMKHCNHIGLAKKYLDPLQPYVTDYYERHLKSMKGENNHG